MYGQLVIGPPGSGKSTYCTGLREFLTGIGRSPTVVNLDPANDELPYECAIDVRELISCSDVMDAMGLGPNGGLMYCIDFLRENIDWLDCRIDAIKLAKPSGGYFLIDCPGQAELFTLSESFLWITKRLTDKHGLKLAAVHLVDAHHCSDPTKIVAASLLSLNTMMRLELPHVNVLSKIDIAETYGPLPFDLEFFAGFEEPRRILALIDEEAHRRVEDAASALGVVSHKPAPRQVPLGEWDGVMDEDEPAGPTTASSGVPVTAPTSAAEAAAASSTPPPTPDASSLPQGPRGEATLASIKAFVARRRALHSTLIDLIDDFGLVGFRPLNIMDKDSVIALTRAIDKANGYTFGALHDGSDAAIGGASTSWAPRPGTLSARAAVGAAPVSAVSTGSAPATPSSLAPQDGQTVGLRGVVAADESFREAELVRAAASKYLSGNQ